MLALILWFILLYQRVNIVRIVDKKGRKDLRRSRIRADLGLIFLGILALLQFSVNFHYGLSLWNADFISPLIE